MTNIAFAIFFASALLVGMVVLMEIGRALGVRRSARDEENARTGLGAIEGAVFGLLALLIAFTFTGAAGRFDHRRDLIAQEVNAIGTAWLRLDLLEPGARTELQRPFRSYLDQRLAAYRLVPDVDAVFAKLTESESTQRQIWALTIAAVQREPGKPLALTLLPAVNDMFDIGGLRTMTIRMHPPMIMYVMLGMVSLLAALMAGYGMSRGKRSWTHIIVFAIAMAGSMYIILDLEFPRLGIIRVDSFDQALIDLRTGMNSP